MGQAWYVRPSGKVQSTNLATIRIRSSPPHPPMMNVHFLATQILLPDATYVAQTLKDIIFCALTNRMKISFGASAGKSSAAVAGARKCYHGICFVFANNYDLFSHCTRNRHTFKSTGNGGFFSDNGPGYLHFSTPSSRLFQSRLLCKIELRFYI
jgi:hypothetical protein